MLHLPSIPEAESEDVTQSHDVKPQSIYAENLLSVSPDQERAGKGTQVVHICQWLSDLKTHVLTSRVLPMRQWHFQNLFH